MIVLVKKRRDPFAREAAQAAKEYVPPKIDPYDGLTPLEAAKLKLRKAGRLTTICQGGHAVGLLDGVSSTPAKIIEAAGKL